MHGFESCFKHPQHIADDFSRRSRMTRQAAKADGVQILGAAYLAVCGQVCTTLADMQANHAAQGTLLRLREELYQETYGRKC